MATRRTDGFKAYTNLIRGQLRGNVLAGAGRAMGKVIAEDAKRRSKSKQVAGSLKVRARERDGRIVVRIEARGPGSYLALWLERGTSPHFITVADGQRNGMSVRRINTIDAEGRRQGKIDGHQSLVINGKFVGETVFHKGARPFPFLRPALDGAFDAALAAGQGYIIARLGKAGITVTEGEDE